MCGGLRPGLLLQVLWSGGLMSGAYNQRFTCGVFCPKVFGLRDLRVRYVYVWGFMAGGFSLRGLRSRGLMSGSFGLITTHDWCQCL